MAFSLGEYQDIFLEEADEQLQELNQNLLELEKKPEDLEIINNIFRAAHSLKSSAAFVGLNELSDLAHKMENLLQGLRDRTLTVTPDIVDIIFKCFDEISSVIEAVASGNEPRRDLSRIIREIQAVSESAKSSGQRSAAGTGEKGPGKSEAGVPKTTFDNDERKKIKQAIDEGDFCFEITVHIEKTA
jgi:two-component system chemotaxis sensor kinase CheA